MGSRSDTTDRLLLHFESGCILVQHKILKCASAETFILTFCYIPKALPSQNLPHQPQSSNFLLCQTVRCGLLCHSHGTYLLPCIEVKCTCFCQKFVSSSKVDTMHLLFYLTEVLHSMHIVFIKSPNGLLNIALYCKILESGQSLRFNLYLYPSNFFFFKDEMFLLKYGESNCHERGAFKKYPSESSWFSTKN